MSNWKENILIKNSVEFSQGIYSTEFNQSLGLRFHEKMLKSAALRDLKDVHLHLAFLETPYYKKAITNFLEGVQNKDGFIAWDVGCGDGRFTELLVELGFQIFFAIDIHLTPRPLAAYHGKEPSPVRPLLN
jgi:2-polyprenyl-3-methyl-5-hydroxy-6-metoxy-1,4-benzoquinol methylase